MNQLVEDGFLGHNGVTSIDCVTMTKIEEGYLFAAVTLFCLIRTGPNKSLSKVLSCLAVKNQNYIIIPVKLCSCSVDLGFNSYLLLRVLKLLQ